MSPRRTVIAALVLLVVAWPPGAARASCAAGVGVDGRLLLGSALRPGAQLPPLGGRYPAIEPGCNDGGGFEPDRRTTVRRFRGVPPAIAVLSLDGATVYAVPGSLEGLRDHPLHGLVPPPPPRRGTCRPVVLRGAAGLASGVAVRLGDGPPIHIDAHTRLTNRRVTTPVSPGQHLRIAASRCGRRLFANRITFTGSTIAPERFAAHFTETSAPHGPSSGFPWLPVALAAAALALLAGGEALRRRT